MTDEDYAAWRDNPVTKWVMDAYRLSADLCRNEWSAVSWANGVADQALLSALRHKAETFASIYEASFEDIQARHDEHERD